jgi:glycosyltransferase involved in cell wall biosynthesis
MLLDLVALMRKRGFHITCRIIGDGPERAALQERTRRLELTHAVDFRCDVAEQKEVYALVKSSRLFVSLSAREGFGMAVLEAIACGIPVLTTSGADNLAQHLVARYSRGVVCEPALDAVAAAVEGTLAESGEQSDDRYRTDSWLADYEWAAMADRLISVYRADAGGGVSPGRRRS